MLALSGADNHDEEERSDDERQCRTSASIDKNKTEPTLLIVIKNASSHAGALG